MSGAIGAAPAATYGTLGLLVADSARASDQLQALTRQAADGYASDGFAGLGAAAPAVLSLAPALAHQTAWQASIDSATGRMQVAQTALSGISDVAASFYAQTSNLNGLSASEVDSVAASARSALRQVAGLLDTQDAGGYVFAGQDSAEAPVPDPDQIGTSGFATQIAAAVASLGSAGAAATIAATLSIASSDAAGTSPFSAALSQPAAALQALRPSAAIGQGQSVPTGVLASANGDVVSQGSSTTGSYARDVLRALATLGSLSGAQASTPGFAALVGDVRTSLGDAITALNGDAGVMGDRQAALAATRTTLGQTGAALQSQLSSSRDVDMAATLSSLSAAQTRLQASYQLITVEQGLSLSKFLAPG